ncbi:MAG: DUF4041 domain-containing protein [Polyangiaceae bacterium]
MIQLILVAVVAIAAVVAALVLARKAARIERQRAEAESQRNAWAGRATDLERENESLRRYRPLVDVEQEVSTLRAVAQAQLEHARQEAARTVYDAQQQAARIVYDAQQQALQTSSTSQAEVTQARQQASHIVADARTQAQQTAGEALKALENVETLRREAKALENVVNGYGDRYIVPTHSVLDDLAEGFGFTEAGASLKGARDLTRRMVKDGKAGTCEYVENNRRETAIAFVVDAFNGKVDSILSRTKADNVGKLQQEIGDAFTLVNMLGKAFRDARVTNEYLQARLAELRWGAAATELKNQERDEQRHIKEQLREEEKARREYERAIRDADKEEDALRKAMAKVQREVEQASDAQRAMYEAQLAELAQKLQVAEEKNQRALSMAQQTKRGHVYIISNVGSFGEDVFKIGLTRRLEPLDRVRELGDASVPFEFDVHAMIQSDDAPALEHTLHRHFIASQMNKVNPRKEFFRVNVSAVREEIEKLGIQASWTMKAAAAHYRESLAIDKAIRENPASYQAWLNKQLVLDATTPLENEIAEAS